MSDVNISNNSSTTSSGPPPWLVQFYVIFVPIFVAFCLFCMMANACVLLTVHWIKGGVSATLRLTVSLAVSDVYTSALLAFSFIHNSYLFIVHNIRTNACVALTFEALRTGGLLTGTFHCFALAVNHYLSTAHPFAYRKVLTPFTTNTVIFLTWIVPPIALLICYGTIPDQGYQSPNGTCMVLDFFNTLEFRLAIFGLIFTLLIAMIILYVAVLIILHRMKRKFAQKSANQSQNQARQLQLKRKRNTFVTTFLISFTFFVGWFPSSLIFVLTCNSCPYSVKNRFSDQTVFIVSMIAQSVILTKTLINPIIYAVRIPEISQVIKDFNKKWCCPARRKKKEPETLQTENRCVRYNREDEQCVVLLNDNNNLHLQQEINGTLLITTP